MTVSDAVLSAVPAPEKRPFPFLSDADIDIAKVQPTLIDGVLGQGDFALLVGRPGVGKSFLALDLAFHVAIGRPWQGRGVTKGHVLYVATEGYAYLTGPRRNALFTYHNTEMTEWHFHNAHIDVTRGPSVDTFLNGVRALRWWLEDNGALPLALVIVDTVSGCMPGADENSPQDMSAFVRFGEEVIREAEGVTFLALHHPAKGKGNKAPRGHGKLEGRADTIMFLGGTTKSGLTLQTYKSRNGFRLDKLRLKAEEVPLPNGESSLVIRPVGGTQSSGPGVSDKALEALRPLVNNSVGLRSGEWLRWCERVLSITKPTFHRYRNQLLGANLIWLDESKRYHAGPRQPS